MFRRRAAHAIDDRHLAGLRNVHEDARSVRLELECLGMGGKSHAGNHLSCGRVESRQPSASEPHVHAMGHRVDADIVGVGGEADGPDHLERVAIQHPAGSVAPVRYKDCRRRSGKADPLRLVESGQAADMSPDRRSSTSIVLLPSATTNSRCPASSRAMWSMRPSTPGSGIPRLAAGAVPAGPEQPRKATRAPGARRRRSRQPWLMHCRAQEHERGQRRLAIAVVEMGTKVSVPEAPPPDRSMLRRQKS